MTEYLYVVILSHRKPLVACTSSTGFVVVFLDPHIMHAEILAQMREPLPPASASCKGGDKVDHINDLSWTDHHTTLIEPINFVIRDSRLSEPCGMPKMDKLGYLH
jgi:hypothetical protein